MSREPEGRTMIEGARKLPTMHLSVCVPWHDNRWSGTVCSKPRMNTSCLALSQIRKEKNDEKEEGQAGRAWNIPDVTLPACVAANGAFMAPFQYCRYVEPPKKHRAYKHFRTTAFSHDAYTVSPMPLGWVKKGADGYPANAKRFGIGFKPELEKLPDKTTDPVWVQARENQLAMLDTFFGALTEGESLVLCYAKQTPLSDTPRRVIVGLGRVVRRPGPEVEYRYQGQTPG